MGRSNSYQESLKDTYILSALPRSPTTLQNTQGTVIEISKTILTSVHPFFFSILNLQSPKPTSTLPKLTTHSLPNSPPAKKLVSTSFKTPTIKKPKASSPAPILSIHRLNGLTPSLFYPVSARLPVFSHTWHCAFVLCQM